MPNFVLSPVESHPDPMISYSTAYSQPNYEENKAK